MAKSNILTLGEYRERVLVCTDIFFFKAPKSWENNCVATFVNNYRVKVDGEYVEKTRIEKRWMVLDPTTRPRDIELKFAEVVSPIQ